MEMGMITMTMNADNKRVITIKSDNPESTVRIASKLLLGKGKWEVLWGEHLIKVTVSDEQLPSLAKALTKPVIQYGIEACGNILYGGNDELWGIWKEESRFTDMLMTEELHEIVRNELLEQLQCSDVFMLTIWVKASGHFMEAVESVSEEMKAEGRMAEKLKKNGWV